MDRAYMCSTWEKKKLLQHLGMKTLMGKTSGDLGIEREGG
jgi:hypothetical protein